MTTIIDVAKLAGVSKSTVSRVVTGKGYVKEETKEKIILAMDECGYIPNILARQFQSGVTKTIGFIAPSYIYTMGKFLQVFMETAKNNGYFVNLYLTGGDKQKEIEALNQLKYKQIDGVFILTRVNEWETIKNYSQYGPISTWNRIEEEWIFSSYVDHYQGYKLALNHLYEKGYKTIGHVLGIHRNLNTQARIRALNDFHQEKGLLLDEDWLIQNEISNGETIDIAKKWLNSLNKPDALAFYSDQVAAQFLSAIQLEGYTSPEDVGIIGFDNSEISELMHLTTVDYSLANQAYNSFVYLYNQLNDIPISMKPLNVTLVQRNTTKN